MLKPPLHQFWLSALSATRTSTNSYLMVHGTYVCSFCLASTNLLYFHHTWARMAVVQALVGTRSHSGGDQKVSRRNVDISDPHEGIYEKCAARTCSKPLFREVPFPSEYKQSLAGT